MSRPDLNPTRHRAPDTVARMAAILDALEASPKPLLTREVEDLVSDWRTRCNVRSALLHLERDGLIRHLTGRTPRSTFRWELVP